MHKLILRNLGLPGSAEPGTVAAATTQIKIVPPPNRLRAISIRRRVA
jgi:hypothetical protein